MKKNSELMKRNKSLTAAVISLAVIAALLLAGIGAGIGLQWDATRALFRGESVYTQADVNAAGDVGKESGYQNGVTEGMESGYNNGFAEAMKHDFIRVGDTIDGLYFNTDSDPDWGSILNWENAHINVTPENTPYMYEQELDLAQMDCYVLFTNYGIPTSLDEVEGDKTNFTLMVVRVVLKDGAVIHILTDYRGLMVGWGPEGYRFADVETTGWDNEHITGGQFKYYTDNPVRIAYVDGNQAAWYGIIGKQMLITPKPAALVDNETVSNVYINPTPETEAKLKEIYARQTYTVEPVPLALITDEDGIFFVSLDVIVPEASADDFILVSMFDRGRDITVYYSTLNFSFTEDGDKIEAIKGWQNVGENGLILGDVDGKDSFLILDALREWGRDYPEAPALSEVGDILSSTPFAASKAYPTIQNYPNGLR